MEPNDQEIRQQLEQEALLGELAGTMVHEFNNFLNTLLLQVTIMETTAPASFCTDLTHIRQEGNKIAKLIKEWQRMKRIRPEVLQTFDINQIVRGLVEGTVSRSFPSVTIALELQEIPCWVQGSFLDLRHLFLLLMQNAIKGSKDSGREPVKVTVRTNKLQQQVCLAVVDHGAQLSPQALAEIFDPSRSARSGLELAACRTLARRLRGRLIAENSPQEGLSISFVPATTDS